MSTTHFRRKLVSGFGFQPRNKQRATVRNSILADIGIIGGLLFTAYSLRSEVKTRRVANLLTVTNNHRQIWSEVYDHPELARVRSRTTSLQQCPITDAEEIFVITIILHLASAFVAQRNQLIVKEEGLRRDVWDFFSRPIPAAVWERMKGLYSDDFVAYVERCRNCE